MYPGIDALARGAAVALVLLLPAVFAFWRLTHRLAAGPRVLRPFVTCVAALAVISALGGVWAVLAERPGLADEAFIGLLIVGAAGVLVAFLVLLLFPRKA